MNLNEINKSCYDLRMLLNSEQDNDLRRAISGLFHEIDRELKFIIQDLRIYNSLKIKKHGNEKS